MSQLLEFIPSKSFTTGTRRWILYAFLLALAYALVRFYAPEFKILVLIAAIVLLISAWLAKDPVSVHIDIERHWLYYTYTNGFNRKHTTTVDLTTAGGRYEYENTRNHHGWYLLLFSGGYFKNRVLLLQKFQGGFTKQQLDEIAAWVRRCKQG
ncbi:hypothetical protein GCM10027037_21220 [Mucilaginibacter koreensis]